MITRLHAGADATLRMLENISAAIAGCAALIAMVLVSADAVLRHLFAHPLTFQLYLTENYLLVAMILLALSWGYRTGGLVRITGLVEKLPEPLRPTVSRLGLAASALLMGWRDDCTAVCPGHILFGLNPVVSGLAEIAPFRPVLRAVKSRVIQVRDHGGAALAGGYHKNRRRRRTAARPPMPRSARLAGAGTTTALTWVETPVKSASKKPPELEMNSWTRAPS